MISYAHVADHAAQVRREGQLMAELRQELGRLQVEQAPSPLRAQALKACCDELADLEGRVAWRAQFLIQMVERMQLTDSEIAEIVAQMNALWRD